MAWYLKPASEGGNNASAGTSPATAVATFAELETRINGSPADAFVMGGVRYGETWAPVRSGTSGTPIRVFADVTGSIFGNGGGKAIITGTNDNITKTRDYGIQLSAIDYRHFYGFHVDATSSYGYYFYRGVGNKVFSCSAFECNVAFRAEDTFSALELHGFMAKGNYRSFESESGQSTSHAGTKIHSSILEVNHANGGNIQIKGTGFDVRCCTILYGDNGGIYIPGGGSQVGGVVARGNIFWGANYAVRDDENAGCIDEDYNIFVGNNQDRSNVAVGANSKSGLLLFEPPIVTRVGFADAWVQHSLQRNSQARNASVPTPPTYFFFGETLQGRSAQMGAVSNYRNLSTHADGYVVEGRGSTFIPIRCRAGETVTVTVDVKWDNNANIGTKPSIKLWGDFGGSDDTDTAAGTGTGETLSVSSSTTADGYLMLELINSSTYGVSDIKAYFDVDIPGYV